MVNTFIVYYKQTNSNKFIPDYKSSAESLDISRLRKQCVEAKQILNILLAFRKLLKLHKFSTSFTFKKFNDSQSSLLDVQKNFLERISIIKKIRKEYLDLDFRFAKINSIIFPYVKR
jgi:Leucine-rich repeat (LRR) protein